MPVGLAAAADHELDLADLAVAAYLPHDVASSGLTSWAPRTSPKAYAGAEAFTTASDSSMSSELLRRTREDRGDLLGHGRAGDGEGDVLLAVADVPREHRAAGDDGADDRGEERLERRIHDSRVLPGEKGHDLLRVGFRTFTRRSLLHPDWSLGPPRLPPHA